jgi:hypothetical protein
LYQGHIQHTERGETAWVREPVCNATFTKF